MNWSAESGIGGSMFGNRFDQALAVTVGAATIATDLVIVQKGYPENFRWLLAVASTIVILCIAHSDSHSMGWRPRPVQGWHTWARLATIIGIAVALCIAIGLGIYGLLGYSPQVVTVSPSAVGDAFLRMCITAPVLEELIYRMVLCVSLVQLVGHWSTIAVSGAVFAALHFAYGNPSPENIVGGFFLAWAYLKSETLLIPVLLHSVGNACALATQAVAWHVLGPAG